MVYPIFVVRFFKRCLKKTALVVFGTIDPFAMTDIIVTRLKRAKHWDSMQSRQSLRMTIETGNLSLRGLKDIVSNMIGVSPLIVTYLKGTGKKDTGLILVVWFFHYLFPRCINNKEYYPFDVLGKGIR